MSPTVRVLAVDDREDNLIALTAVLDSLPVEVVPATSGPAALKHLLSDDFALILLDVVMPGMDGFETAVHIKSRPRTRDIPIIFLTANGQGADQVFRGYASGAADYLTKPFDPWVLRGKVAVFTELYRRALKLREKAEALTERLSEVTDLVARLRSSQEGNQIVEDAALDRLHTDLAHLRADLKTII